MKAALFTEHGPASNIKVVDAPMPSAGEGEVVVEMRAVSLNGFDPQIVQGTTELRTPLPMVPCGDGAGVVVEVGAGVDSSTAKVGDRVSLVPFILGQGMMGETVAGTCREYLALPATNLVAIPDNVSYVEAAALPIAYATALHMIGNRGRVQAGEKLLVLGATGGVGTCVVQLAKLIGAEVIACGSGEWKLERLLKLGADHVIDSTRPDWVEAVREIAGHPRVFGGGGGVDVVVNYVGGDTWAPALRTLARHGRVLVCGASAGAQPQTDLRYIWSFEHTVVGSNGWLENDHEEILQMVSDGRLAPVIHAVRPLDEVAEAVQELADRKVFGKSILVMGPEANER